MAGLDEQTDIRVHETDGHRNILPIREHRATVRTALLDKAKDIIPTPTVESRRVCAELEKDFLHLERGWERLDENSRADGAVRKPDIRLREVEDIIPEPRLTVVLHFREIEVRAGAAGDELLGIMVEVWLGRR